MLDDKAENPVKLMETLVKAEGILEARQPKNVIKGVLRALKTKIEGKNTDNSSL